MAVKQLSDGGSAGVALGQSASDKIAFFGKAPTAQHAATTAPVATAASTSAHGYTEAQANAIVTWIRTVDAELKAKGLIAT